MLLVGSYPIDCPDACGGQALLFSFDMGDDDPDAADEYTELNLINLIVVQQTKQWVLRQQLKRPLKSFN